jgi:5'-phosphate synthase pdxT subunit
LKKIGILAIQGDFAKHAEMIEKIGHTANQVRTVDQLWQNDALIIPGGESSTLLKIINRFNLFDEIKRFAESHPVLGTCAGLILLSKQADHLDTPTLNLIDISVTRNAYGRQRDSFVDNVTLSLNGKTQEFTGIFIRAPKIAAYGSGVYILGMHGDQAVMAASKNILVCSFHPELTENTAIHEYFIKTYLNT